MKWASAVSERESLEAAIAEVSGSILHQLDTGRPDLIAVFLSPHHRGKSGGLEAAVREKLGAGVLVGCSAGGVIGGGREVEHRPGLSMTAAILPGVELAGFHLEMRDLPEADAGPDAWERLVAASPRSEPQFLLLADPFTFETEHFLEGLDRAFPDSTKIGGLASGGQRGGHHDLILGAAVHRSGLVGLAMSGDVAVDAIVAQGCRPIGDPMFVTRCTESVLVELDSRPARMVLDAMVHRLDASDRQLARSSLFLGIGMRESQREYRQGDFLIRNILGIVQETGGLAVGAELRENMVVQFHLRDAKTSADDLEALLAGYRKAQGGAAPRGSLLFSCLGRGVHLYGRPDHDTETLRRHLGDVPLGGFFCNGEIGPVQGMTFLHGYTSSFGLFRSRR